MTTPARTVQPVADRPPERVLDAVRALARYAARKHDEAATRLPPPPADGRDVA